MTHPNIQQAKEWAESRASGNYLLSEGTKEAVKVIQSLPDQWIDAEKLRGWIDGMAVSDDPGGARKLLDYIKRDFLTPPLPTLADMPPEEREACLWMQVDLPRHLPGAVLADPGGPGTEARVIYQDGATFTVKHEEVTPLPGPKLEWPWDGVVDAEIVEDEPTPPRPEDVPEGEPWTVRYEGMEIIGCRNEPESTLPWLVIRRDGHQYDYCRDTEITLISRLVPEVKP